MESEQPESLQRQKYGYKLYNFQQHPRLLFFSVLLLSNNTPVSFSEREELRLVRIGAALFIMRR